MEQGQCCVLYIIALLGYIVYLCEVGCQDEASEPIWVSRPTDSRLRSPAKLTWTCFTCARYPVVQRSSVCVELLPESKKSVCVYHWYVRKRLARCRTYIHTMRDDQLCQMVVVWRALGVIQKLFLVVTYSLTTQRHYTLKRVFVVI